MYIYDIPSNFPTINPTEDKMNHIYIPRYVLYYDSHEYNPNNPDYHKQEYDLIYISGRFKYSGDGTDYVNNVFISSI